MIFPVSIVGQNIDAISLLGKLPDLISDLRYSIGDESAGWVLGDLLILSSRNRKKAWTGQEEVIVTYVRN